MFLFTMLLLAWMGLFRILSVDMVRLRCASVLLCEMVLALADGFGSNFGRYHVCFLLS